MPEMVSANNSVYHGERKIKLNINKITAKSRRLREGVRKGQCPYYDGGKWLGDMHTLLALCNVDRDGYRVMIIKYSTVRINSH